jgi:hypothetical protein
LARKVSLIDNKMKIKQKLISPKRQWFVFSLIGLGGLCWGRLLVLNGIWWDDWAWIWHYFSSEDLAEFLLPLKSLRHELDGYLLFLHFKWLDIAPGIATNIWSVCKFIMFIVNPLLLYCISKSILSSKSILPKAIAVVHLVSPVVNNLCLVELDRQLYLFVFLLGIMFSVKSVDKKILRGWYYSLAILFSLISMVGLETFIFADVARLMIVFYIFFKKWGIKVSTALRKAVFYWLPFIAIGTALLIRGMGLLTPRSGPYAHIYEVKSKELFDIICKYMVSLRYLFIGNISHFIKRLLFTEPDFFLILIASVTMLLAGFVVFRKNKITEDQHESCRFFSEAKLAVVFGVCLIVAGLFPYVMVREPPSFGLVSRHALFANVGVSVFIASVVAVLYYKGFVVRLFCYLLFFAVIFMGVFQCNTAIKAYDNDWKQQRHFWWQFLRQVPDIKDNTYLIVDMPREEKDYFDRWRGDYEFASVLNLLYAKSRADKDINNHFARSTEDKGFNINRELSYLKMPGDVELEFNSYRGPQKYHPKNLIVASYHNGHLYLNREVNKLNSSREGLELLSAHSSPDQIIYNNKNVTFPFGSIIGHKP